MSSFPAHAHLSPVQVSRGGAPSGLWVLPGSGIVTTWFQGAALAGDSGRGQTRREWTSFPAVRLARDVATGHCPATCVRREEGPRPWSARALPALTLLCRPLGPRPSAATSHTSLAALSAAGGGHLGPATRSARHLGRLGPGGRCGLRRGTSGSPA